MAKTCTVYFDCAPSFEDALPVPQKSVGFMPEWYKKMPSTVACPHGGPSTTTVKYCVPFREGFTLGYIMPLWMDLEISAVGDDVEFVAPERWQGPQPHFHPPEQLVGHPLADKVAPSRHVLKLVAPWRMRTSPGWSMLMMQPLNHLNDDFMVMGGVIDTDKFYSEVNVFLMFRRETNRLRLPRGTPLAQLVPINRNTWDSQMEIGTMDEARWSRTIHTLGSRFKGAYRDFFWVKK